MHNSKTKQTTGKSILKWLLIVLGILAAIPVIAALIFLILNHTNGKIVTSGETRRYLLYVPDTYDASKPTPLVINIHGFAQWPANQRDISNWNDLADEKGFIVVYPMGTKFPLRWNSHIPVETSEESRKEVVFISDLIDTLSEQYTLDTARIYASGLSNGAGMSFVLACTLSDRIAAIGGVAGAYTYPWDACNPSRPVPLIAFHGMQDQVVPYNGGPSRSFDTPFPNIPEWMAEYARHNGCSPETLQLPANRTGERDQVHPL